MTISAENTAKIINAEFIGRDKNSVIDNISIDSRSLQNGATTLFFALSGPNNDAHRFIPELIAKGVRNFVVTKFSSQYSNANFFLVDDTLAALQVFAASHRKRYNFPVIGITGSNGKTIVKEWLNFLLSPDFNIIRSPKSYNSQVGVPLSVLGINENHDLGIFEAGISEPGEMAKLEQIIRPTIGILTNIGSAHDEGFESEKQKIHEKLKLFEHAEVAIYRKELIQRPYNKAFTWSFDDASADVLITKNELSKGTMMQFSQNGSEQNFDFPFTDNASVENGISCIMAMLHLGYDPGIINKRIANLYPVDMRLMVKNGVNGSTIIDDSYSSDFQSLKIALDFLESQKHQSKKTVILSDIYQSGLAEEALYQRVSKLISSNKISRVIGIGKTISKYGHFFPNPETYPGTDEFLKSYDINSFHNETVLIKGARNFRFERIVTLLEEKTHETVLEINLNAISHNLNFFRSKLRKGTKLMVMVKAFGYGSGGFEIAKLLEHHNVDYLGVAFADEGISLKNAGITLPIMVLNPETSSFSSIIRYGLEPEIYSLKGLHAFIGAVSEIGVSKYPVHIKIDTGMHRLGFESNNFTQLIDILKSTDKITVKSILSHMATSDDPEHHDFAKSQIRQFEELSSKLIETLNISPIRHILNTSGISNYPEAQYDMVRLGIGIYGVSNDPDEQKFLANVGSLKSVISQLRTIEQGESVGYGRRFVAVKRTKIATIPIGYADGIPRSWGNQNGYVTINNRKAPIVGSICMDMLMADVSEIDCAEGDSVTIFGESPTVTEIAEKLKTIPYEILTGISQRVKRVFYRE